MNRSGDHQVEDSCCAQDRKMRACAREACATGQRGKSEFASEATGAGHRVSGNNQRGQACVAKGRRGLASVAELAKGGFNCRQDPVARRPVVRHSI
eukprot:scaffold7066_cov253-Pinguiococcus_pyrenoidosus.AAC.20